MVSVRMGTSRKRLGRQMRQMQQQLSGQISQMHQHLCVEMEQLNGQMVQLNGQMDQLNGRMDQLQAQGAQAVTGIQLQFSQMNDDLRQVIESWNEKFDQVLGQLDTMESRFATMDNRFANFATELTGINSKLDKVLDQIRKGHVVDNEILARLTALENMEDETTALLAALEKKGRAPLAPFNKGVQRCRQSRLLRLAPGLLAACLLAVLAAPRLRTIGRTPVPMRCKPA